MNAKPVGGAGSAGETADAWVNFDGTGTVSIRDSVNVSSITDIGAGDYDVNFASSMANANYSVSTGYRPDFLFPGAAGSPRQCFVASLTTSKINIKCGWHDTGGSAKLDFPEIMIQVFGD